MRGESAKQVAIDVLRSAGEPLHTKEITKRVIESGRSSGLKGKTPKRRSRRCLRWDRSRADGGLILASLVDAAPERTFAHA